MFVDFCVFTCYYHFLHDLIIKLFCRPKQNNFMITSGMQKLVKTGKYTEINKQSDFKVWLSWRKYGTVSYSFSCNAYFSRNYFTYTNTYFFKKLFYIGTLIHIFQETILHSTNSHYFLSFDWQEKPYLGAHQLWPWCKKVLIDLCLRRQLRKRGCNYLWRIILI